MKKILFVLLATALACSVYADTESPLHGEWTMTSMIYRGAEVPPLNPNLNLRWSFYENGTERLYWSRLNEPGFCERFANYKVSDGRLLEKVFAVNPLNNRECLQDPDMQLGRETVTRIDIQPQQILLHLALGDEELIYVLKEVL